MDVRTRTVPARTLAVRAKEVFQPEVESFIMNSFSELFSYAASHPGVRPLETTPTWPTYAMFHGPVTPHESALVEVCIVVSEGVAPEGDITVRVEPAHQEAYVEVSRQGIAFPEILDAYAAVQDWVEVHGELLEGLPSREVYIADVMAAGPDDHVCDVAFPFEPRA